MLNSAAIRRNKESEGDTSADKAVLYASCQVRKGGTPLHNATYDGLQARVRFLLQHRALQHDTELGHPN